MADDFDSGILKELTEATKLLSKVSKELNRTMKGMTDSTEKSVRRIKKTTDESHRKSDEQNKKDEESTKKQGKMAKNQADRQAVNTQKSKERTQAMELDNALKMDRLFARTASRRDQSVMGFIKLLGQQSDVFGGASKMSELESKVRSGTKLTDEEKSTYDKLQESNASSSPLMPFFKMFDKYFGAGSKWDKFFQGHGKMAAGIIGGGAAGIGAKAVMQGVQMAIEASPMLQQMLKLWKFGIMMVLRPIGDFFGFVMRPIMILMLRKFIIPFYQKYMPAMIKLGDEIGKKLVGVVNTVDNVLSPTIIDKETGEERPKTQAEVFGGYLEAYAQTANAGFEAAWWVIANVLETYAQAANTFIGGDYQEADAAEGGIGIDSEGYKELDDNMASLAEQFRELQKEVEKTKNGWGGDEGLPDYVNPIETGVSTELTPAQKDAQLMMTNPAQWQQQQNMKAQREGIYNDPITIPVDRMAESSQKAKTIEDAYTKYKENNTSVSARGQTGGVGLMDKNGDGKIDYMDYMANGGIIDEPILGKGLRTGKGYMMGEAGKEAVIPLNKTGGTNITVNIQNMSASKQDLNALRTTILSVVQEANTRRGRI